MPFWLWLIVGGLISAFLVYATRKGWVSWRGGSGIATLTAFHDFQPKDKQEAIEIVIERKAGKRWSADESGEGNDTQPPDPSPRTDRSARSSHTAP